MWKSASRNIKSIFCKQQLSQSNVSTREARNDSNVNRFRKLSPAQCGPSHRSYGCEGQRREPFAQNEKEKDNPKSDKKCFLNDFPHLLGVLSWSGICVLGLYIIQPSWRRKWLYGKEQSEKCSFNIFSQYTQDDYFQLFNYFTKAQHYVLPKTVPVKQKKKIHISEVDENEFDEIEKAHMSVTGSLSNFYGATCMSKGNYREAIVHFEEAAQVQNPAGMYNLGVCYETGMGINQDLKKAADLYKRASDLGHSTATYNLGVFYVHGLGDLKTDLKKARKLFQIAAGQGQPNAQKALDMEASEVTNYKIQSNEKINVSKAENFMNINDKHVQLSCRKHDSLGKYGIFSDSVINVFKSYKAEEQSASSDDSGAVDLSPETHCVFN